MRSSASCCNDGEKLGPPKTKASVRTIPLPDVVLNALSRHVRAYASNGFVFTNEAGQPVRRNRFSDVWRRAIRDAGVPAGASFHDLRHNYASLLIRHGESVKTVQARLGHASETLDTHSICGPTRRTGPGRRSTLYSA